MLELFFSCRLWLQLHRVYEATAPQASGNCRLNYCHAQCYRKRSASKRRTQISTHSQQQWAWKLNTENHPSFTVVPSSTGLIDSVLLQIREQHVLWGLCTQSLDQIDFCRPQSAHGQHFLTLGIHHQARNQTDAFTLTSNHTLSLSHYGHRCPSGPLPLVFKAFKHHLLLAFVSYFFTLY